MSVDSTLLTHGHLELVHTAGQLEYRENGRHVRFLRTVGTLRDILNLFPWNEDGHLKAIGLCLGGLPSLPADIIYDEVDTHQPLIGTRIVGLRYGQRGVHLNLTDEYRFRLQEGEPEPWCAKSILEVSDPSHLSTVRDDLLSVGPLSDERWTAIVREWSPALGFEEAKSRIGY